MRFRTAQFSLLALFVFFLAIQEAVFLATFLYGKIYMDNLKTLSVQVLSIYSIPLGGILGGIFGKEKARERRTDPASFGTALTVSGLWNLLLLACSVLFAVKASGLDAMGVVTDYLQSVATAGSCLITAVITYFHAK